MSPEERDAINRLLDTAAGAASQKAALKWISEYLEEGHILDLPAPKALLRALESFAGRSEADLALRTRAENLMRKYRR